jgi:gluconate 2-dehydrogenase gamma chain
MDRRRFIKGATSATALAGLGAVSAACKKKDDKKSSDTKTAAKSGAFKNPAEPQGGWKALDKNEAHILAYALDRIIPAGTPTGAPGATETNVIVFVDRELAEKHFSGFKRLLKEGAKALDDVAQKTEGKAFVALDAQKADALLADFQRQKVKGIRFAQARFFAILHTFGMEGFLGSPRHGGNRDKKAWAWLGIKPGCPQMHGATDDQCGH